MDTEPEKTMNLKTLRHIGAAIGLAIASVFVTFYFENIAFGIIAFVGGGFMYLSGDAFIYQCRMWSTCFFANIGKKGHSSIIEADMFNMPSPQEDEPEYKIMMAGGSSVPILPFHGFGPVFICPNAYVKRDFHGAVLAIADWRRVGFDNLDTTYQDALTSRLEHFNQNTTDIYFSDTTEFNEKMKSSTYIDLSKRSERLQSSVNTLQTENEDLRKEIMSNMNMLKQRQKDVADEKPRYRTVQIVE